MMNLKMFTEDEKAILRSLPSSLKWIARDRDGWLFVYEDKPKRDGIAFIWGNPHTESAGMKIFEHIFKGVTFENSPIRFRAEVLDEVEKVYLKSVLKPFQKRIAYVKKLNTECGGLQYIRVMFKNSDWMDFPVFPAGTMYKGMTVNEEYSLDELGIKY